jgi:hypothetical protein
VSSSGVEALNLLVTDIMADDESDVEDGVRPRPPSSEEVRAYVEQLRAKYREEALEAVRAAEVRGYERAKAKYDGIVWSQQEQLNTVQQTNRLLQNSLSAYTSGETNIKELMEIVFREVKAEYQDQTDNGREIIARMKVSILHLIGLLHFK